jgi:nicotinamidase-related amidase
MNQALIIVDIQNDYFENGTNPLEGSLHASINASRILGRFRDESLPIIHIQHIALSPTATFFLPDTFGAEIHVNVKPIESEKIFIKHYPNSFRETGLLDYLKEKEITDLVICGMMTHMCIDTTVRAAKDFGFNIILIGDACATKELKIGHETIPAHEVHNAFLAAINAYFATVVKTKEFLAEK